MKTRYNPPWGINKPKVRKYEFNNDVCAIPGVYVDIDEIHKLLKLKFKGVHNLTVEMAKDYHNTIIVTGIVDESKDSLRRYAGEITRYLRRYLPRGYLEVVDLVPFKYFNTNEIGKAIKDNFKELISFNIQQNTYDRKVHVHGVTYLVDKSEIDKLANQIVKFVIPKIPFNFDVIVELVPY